MSREQRQAERYWNDQARNDYVHNSREPWSDRHPHLATAARFAAGAAIATVFDIVDAPDIIGDLITIPLEAIGGPITLALYHRHRVRAFNDGVDRQYEENYHRQVEQRQQEQL
jgi:hypothetical protein